MPKKTEFYQRSWEIDKPKAIVLLVHGLAEHTERYQSLGTYLNLNHYALIALDLPGHGRSSGKPGHIDRFSDYHKAVHFLYKTAKDKHPNLPIFLLGHSMGGLISTQFLLDKQKLFKGAILSAPALESPQQPPDWQASIIKLIAKIAPKLGLIKLDASGISQDKSVVNKYMKDPLVYKGKLSARFLVEMFNAMNDCKSRAKRIKLPILIMHGDRDVMTAPNGSTYLHNNISSSDKALKIYKGFFHEIFNEPDAESVYSDMVTWLDSHC